MCWARAAACPCQLCAPAQTLILSCLRHSSPAPPWLMLCGTPRHAVVCTGWRRGREGCCEGARARSHYTAAPLRATPPSAVNGGPESAAPVDPAATLPGLYAACPGPPPLLHWANAPLTHVPSQPWLFLARCSHAPPRIKAPSPVGAPTALQTRHITARLGWGRA